MGTLIGNGSHGTDIWRTLNHKKWDWMAHHSYYLYDGGTYIVGINDPHLRRDVADKIGGFDRKWVHPHAYVQDTTLETGVHVNYGVTMTRTYVESGTTISPGVTICGGVYIGSLVLIGAGATICDRVTIYDDVTVGAGCVVLPESRVDMGATIIGVPARYADGRPVK